MEKEVHVTQLEQFPQVSGEGRQAHFPLDPHQKAREPGESGSWQVKGEKEMTVVWVSCSCPPLSPFTGHLEEAKAECAHLVGFNAGTQLGCRNLERCTKQLPQIQVLLASPCSDVARTAGCSSLQWHVIRMQRVEAARGKRTLLMWTWKYRHPHSHRHVAWKRNRNSFFLPSLNCPGCYKVTDLNHCRISL